MSTEQYHFDQIEKNGRNTGWKIKLSKPRILVINLNTTRWICSRIPAALDYT